MCRPLNSDADSPTEICLYIKKEKNPHDLQSRVLTGLGATTPACGNEQKTFSYTNLNDIPTALATTDLSLIPNADLSQG